MALQASFIETPTMNTENALTTADPAGIRQAFAAARGQGMRARDAAQHIGLSEGEVLAAHMGWHERSAGPLPSQLAPQPAGRRDSSERSAGPLPSQLAPQPAGRRDAGEWPLRAVPVRRDWLALLQSLQACGPLMALTRNETTVHEKTGVYQKLSCSGHIGLALGPDIDLRLFFNQWHAGFVVTEEQAGGEPQTSLQFFDEKGVAVHKIYPRPQTDKVAWEQMINRWIDPDQALVFRPAVVAEGVPAALTQAVVDASKFADAWGAMTDTHQFFPLLKQFGLERQQAFRMVEGQYAHRVANSAMRDMLLAASLDGTPIMVFVGSPGCIQIHTGPVHRVEPMEIRGMRWLNVLDPGFNLHLREDQIASTWVVEKPTDDGVVTSLEMFDGAGALMAMCFGARKPGHPELPAWRELLQPLLDRAARPTESMA